MTILSYSPSHVDPETLERLTIGPSRQRLLETLMEAIRAEVGRSAHQHHLLIGPRGSGKTHTLTLVAHRLRTDSELSSQTLPLVLAEEEVARHPADLLIKVLQKLAEELERLDAPGAVTARKEVRAVLSALRSEGDDERALETAMEGLEAASSALGRLLVVTVENLHLLLYAGPGLSRRSVEPGQWSLRKLLLPSRGLLLLAGAPSLFGEVCDRRAPFFDFFRIHHLEELPPEEMLELIRTRLHLELQGDRLDPAQRTRLGALAEGFDQRAPKLRGLLPLTGGLPRFAHLLFDLLAETEMQRSVDLLSRFLDEQTPYFQARLDPRLVPEAELEILDFLATSEGPRTNAEIAAGLRAKSPNAIATYMKRLIERGLVRQSGTSKRDVRYDVAEPLFRVWRRFRIGRAEREQIALLAELVAALFEPREIEEERRMLTGMEQAAFRLKVLEAAGEWHARLARTAPSEKLPDLLTEEEKALEEEAEREYMTGSLQKAYELYGSLVARLRQRNPQWFGGLLARFSHMAFLAGRNEEALRAAEEGEALAGKDSDDLGRADAIRSRADILFQLGDNQTALDALRDAEQLYSNVGSDLGRADAIRSRADILFQLGDNQHALDALRDAEQLFSNVGSDLGRANAIKRRADILFLLGDNQAALDALRDAERLYSNVGFDLGRANTIRSRADILFQLGDNQAALDALRDAEKLFSNVGDDLGRANAIRSRADVLFRLGDNQAALNALRDAEKLFSNVGSDLGRANAITSRADILFRLGDNQAALDGYQNAQTLYQKVGSEVGLGGCSWGYGRIAFEQGKWEEGLDHLLSAYHASRKVGHVHNAGLAQQTVWTWLSSAGAQIEQNRFLALLRTAEPLVRGAGDDETARAALARFVMGAFTRLGPEPLLELLPVLEAGLSSSKSSFLQPVRLAAEIRVGRRSKDLPEEPDEMRRAVREVLKAAEAAAPKEKGKGNKTKGKRPSGKRARKTAPPRS